MDQPIFWIQKLDKKGQSKELHDDWIDLIQRIEKGSFLEQELLECLKILYAVYQTCPQKHLNGATTLHISALFGIKSIVEFIVSYNNNPNPSNDSGFTPIYIASEKGNIDIVKFLATKVDNPNPPTNAGFTPIYIASKNGHIDVVKFLATKVNDPNPATANGATPLSVATLSGHSDIVEFLSSII